MPAHCRSQKRRWLFARVIERRCHLLSLRSFHVFFIILAMLAADLFGVWSLVEYGRTHSAAILSMGLVSLAGGLGLLAYGIWFLHKMDRARIQ
jgi:hypothetical protein